MPGPGSITSILTCVLTLLLAGSNSAGAKEPLVDLCGLVLQEERIELEEFRLDLDLARSELVAYEQIYRLIEELWENDATERMVYLEARYERDAARVTLDRADLIVLRQEALIEHYSLACRPPGSGPDGGDGAGARRENRRRYQQAHCGSLEKAVEAAEIRLAFNRELLASIHELRAGRVATRPDVILAELDVEKEEKRLEDASTRAEACRNEARSK